MTQRTQAAAYPEPWRAGLKPDRGRWECLIVRRIAPGECEVYPRHRHSDEDDAWDCAHERALRANRKGEQQ